MTVSTAPDSVSRPASDNSIRFVAAYRPALKAGNYQIGLDQTIVVPDDSERFVHTARFAVGGERFALDPAEIASVYPPQNAQGDFSNVLPHVVITRRTLPWERRLFPEASGIAATAPWLALLVFDETDGIADPQAMMVADLVSAGMHADGRLPAGTLSYPGLGNLEAGERNADPCLVLDLDLAAFRRIAPDAADIAWLAHGRTATTRRKAAQETGALLADLQDYAVIVANRLPRMGGRSRACLVSLEGLGACLPGAPATEMARIMGLGATAGRLRLACLATWRFQASEEPLGFVDWFSNLDRGPLRPPGSADAYLEAAAAMGYRPMAHSQRDGGSAASWYRGPLVPQAVARTVTLPLDGADGAIVEDPATGLLDVSYAAAWQAGQLLALQDRAFSTGLYRWKIATRRAVVADVERQMLAQRFGQPSASGDMTASAAAWIAGWAAAGTTCAATGSETSAPTAARSGAGAVPVALIEWLARLRLLKGVPFSYLAADAGMLPAESIRFFHVDPNWLDCLVDGAYSLGRFTAGDLVQDAGQADELQGAAADAARAAARGPGMAAGPLQATGFLLRSRAVSFWPGLETEARDAAGTTLPLLRFDTLAPGLMIALFDGVASDISVHEPAEAIHFGLDLHLVNGAPARAVKALRTVTGEVPATLRVDGCTVEIASLAARIGAALGGTAFTPAEFAREMIEGVGSVTFRPTTGSAAGTMGAEA